MALQDRVITINQAMELLPPNSITPNSLRRFAHEGRLTEYRLGKKLMLDREEVLGLIQVIDH